MLPRLKDSQSSQPVPGKSTPVPALSRARGRSGIQSQKKPLVPQPSHFVSENLD